MDLVLWRHAEAKEWEPGCDDLARPLVSKGHKQAARMAAWLDRQLPASARVYCSPAVRTVQTAEALDRPFHIKPVLAPDASPMALRELVGHHLDAAFFQCRQQILVVDAVLLLHQRMNAGGQSLESVVGVGPFFVAAELGRHVGSRPHLEEFVQVGRHDAHIAQPLQQRHVWAARPVQHPLGERQDALIPVQQRKLGRCRHDS